MVKTADELERVASEVLAFYAFVAAARTAVAERKVSQPAAVAAIRNAVEAPTARGSTIESYATFASAIHDDIERMAGVWPVLEGRSPQELERFDTLIDVELSGLDHGWGLPARFATTRVRAVLLGLALASAWAAAWSYVWGYDIGADLRDIVISRLLEVPAARTIAAFVFVFGGALGIAVIASSWHLAARQAAFLRFLKRCIALKRLVHVTS